MSDHPATTPDSPASFGDVPVVAPNHASAAVDRAAHVASLLESLDEAAAQIGRSSRPKRGDTHEMRLVQARLGIASGLHTALRYKDPATASHSLRVALGCSSWAAVLELEPEVRDAIEVAALLHDVGKIGVPDKVLLKPGRLLPEEAESMSRHTAMTVEILASCGVPGEVLEIVRHARAHYDGSLPDQDRAGDALPLAARMLSIVDAFDSMTTDHVYRPARSRERALAELFQCAGTQFDPELVRKFSELFSQHQNLFTEKLARRWLHGLSQREEAVPWSSARVAVPTISPPTDTSISLFEKMLIDNMHDGVLFVDAHSRILLWNTGSERLTGVSSDAARGRTFLPSLLDMHNSHHGLIADEDCPVARSIV